MQLNSKVSVRRALAAATCTLLGTSAASAQAEGSDENWRVDSSVLYYSEQDRVTVIEPVVFVRKTIGEDSFLNVRLIFDAMSGASANGATPTSTAQTFTSPSGTSVYTTSAGKTPLHDFTDQRVALAVEWDRPVDRLGRSLYGVNASVENDYRSLGASYTRLRDYNDKLTTLTMGIAGSADSVMPIGGTPVPLSLMSAIVVPPTPPPGGEDDGGDEGGETKLTADAIVGVTQVLTRRALTQFNYSLGYSSGYLTDPYKVVSVIDGTTGATLDYRFEKRPDTRLRESLYWKIAYHLDHDVVHFSYRYFWDDWGIHAHTVDLHYRLSLPGRSYLQPHVRYATQTAADFFTYSLVASDPVPAYASADYRLGELTTVTYGLKLGLPVGRSGDLSLRLESITQSGNGHPADAIGIQRNYDLFPTIHTTVAQITYTGRF